MERREEQIRDGIRKYGLKGKSTGADQALRACKRGSNWIVGRGGGSGRSSVEVGKGENRGKKLIRRDETIRTNAVGVDRSRRDQTEFKE